MRKLPAALAVAGLVAVTLVGCSSSPAASCTSPTSADSSAMGLIDVSGAADSLPTVDVSTPFHVDSTQFETLTAGEGTPITDDDQLVVLDISLTDGTTGKTVVSTAYDGDLTRVFALSQWTQTFPGFSAALHCATPGSRVAIALAPGDIDSQTAVNLGLGEGDSAIAVVDVRKVYLDRADGADQYNSGFGLPSVVRAPNGRPGIIVPDGSAPSDLVVQVLKKGDGEVVTGDTPVRLHYTGVVWSTKKVFDTTWDGEPQSVTLSSSVPGFAQAVTGQTVGSQILVVVPPDQGYGTTQQGSVPASSTLVYVIDILGIDATVAAQ